MRLGQSSALASAPFWRAAFSRSYSEPRAQYSAGLHGLVRCTGWRVTEVGAAWHGAGSGSGERVALARGPGIQGQQQQVGGS